MNHCSHCGNGILERFQVMADPKKNGRIRYFIRRCPSNASVGYCKPCANSIKRDFQESKPYQERAQEF